MRQRSCAKYDAVHGLLDMLIRKITETNAIRLAEGFWKMEDVDTRNRVDRNRGKPKEKAMLEWYHMQPNRPSPSQKRPSLTSRLPPK